MRCPSSGWLTWRARGAGQRVLRLAGSSPPGMPGFTRRMWRRAGGRLPWSSRSGEVDGPYGLRCRTAAFSARQSEPRDSGRYPCLSREQQFLARPFRRRKSVSRTNPSGSATQPLINVQPAAGDPVSICGPGIRAPSPAESRFTTSPPDRSVDQQSSGGTTLRMDRWRPEERSVGLPERRASGISSRPLMQRSSTRELP